MCSATAPVLSASRSQGDDPLDPSYSVVSIADTGTAAIIAAEQHQPDLILMDIRLDGEMDGIDAALEIRSNHDIPIIFMSAYEDEDTRQRTRAADPAGFLSKLTDDSELHTAIETALAGQRDWQQIGQSSTKTFQDHPETEGRDFQQSSWH